MGGAKPIDTYIPIARPQLGAEEEAAVLEVMRSGRLAQGERVKAFEEAFAGAVGARFAVATANGTLALELALEAHGVGAGDEVITTPLTFIASANAIVRRGARPVFCDVDDTLNLDPRLVEAAIGQRTRAILPVHLHGNPCDMNALTEIASKHGLELIQDACQAVGATILGTPLGTFGTAVYSLYATKNITTGEGGMVVTNDPDIARKCASVRHQGYVAGNDYLHDVVGCNFRLTEIQAAIGVCQLARLPEITAKRRRNAAFFDEAIAADRFPRPRVLPEHLHVYHQYVLRIPSASTVDRGQVQKRLEAAGIGSAVHYPVPAHRQPAYADYRCQSLPCAEAAAAEILSIPVHPGLQAGHLERIAGAFGKL